MKRFFLIAVIKVDMTGEHPQPCRNSAKSECFCCRLKMTLVFWSACLEVVKREARQLFEMVLMSYGFLAVGRNFVEVDGRTVDMLDDGVDVVRWHGKPCNFGKMILSVVRVFFGLGFQGF